MEIKVLNYFVTITDRENRKAIKNGNPETLAT